MVLRLVRCDALQPPCRCYRDGLACEGWTVCIQPDAGAGCIALGEPDDSRADLAWCDARTDADAHNGDAVDCDAVHGHTIDRRAVHGHTVDCDTLDRHAQHGGAEHGDTEVIFACLWRRASKSAVRGCSTATPSTAVPSTASPSMATPRYCKSARGSI